MKLIIDEIIGTHPAGKMPGEFRRARRENDVDIDAAAAQLIMALTADDPLWLASSRYEKPRLTIVLAHRLCVIEDDVSLLVDVCTPELFKTIKAEGVRFGLHDYVSWAESYKVWS